MLDFGFYNMDCMEGMKEFPDKYFDLAIVDPPYGDGGGTFNTSDGTRFGERFDRYKGGVWNTPHLWRKEEIRNLQEQEEHGRQNSEKNCSVGCCAG